MEIVTSPPPSSGGIILLQALGILEGMPLDAQKIHAAAERAIEREKGSPPGADCPYLDERTARRTCPAARRRCRRA